MASSGDAYINSSVTEEYNYTYTCLPCDAEGKKLKAVGYCINCKEYLCRNCYDVHLIPSLTKRHVLLDEANMTDVDKDANASKGSGRCQVHREQIIEYHCPSHSFFGCHICSHKHQKDCRDVLYIPETAQNITSTSEFQEFTNRVTGISSKCTKLKSEINIALKTSEECHDEAVGSIKQYKKELLDAIDKLENALLDKAKGIKEEDSASLNALAQKVSSILSESQKIASRIELLQNKEQNCELYTTMVQLKDKLHQLEEDLQTVEGGNLARDFVYRPNSGLLDTLKSPFGLGKFSKTGVITKMEHKVDINCKIDSDKSKCRFIGAVMLSCNQIVLTDETNQNVRVLDTCQSKIVADLTLSSFPLGVCHITATKVALALASERKIVFVDTTPSLRINRELNVGGECRGVGYCDGKLVVSYHSADKVEIMDLQGTVLKKITTDTTGQNLFSQPYHVAINPISKLIYVSNYASNNIVCMKLDGTVLSKYTDSELSGPWQATFDSNGMMYVCGRKSNNAHQVTADCKKVKVMLTAADGLSLPESIVYNQADDKMYIGMYNNTNLKVFNVSYDGVK